MREPRNSAAASAISASADTRDDCQRNSQWSSRTRSDARSLQLTPRSCGRASDDSTIDVPVTTSVRCASCTSNACTMVCQAST
ncbi:MAG TPA: hypothetical protein VIK61_15670 [Acidimicrobiia bacterium]